jgi:hypothetical protein
MSHSNKFDKVKSYYMTIYKGERMWNEARVKNAVEKNWITSEEYEEIVGQKYEA